MVSNVCPIASWLVYSENYLDFKEKYDIDEMYDAFISKSNVYLVTTSYVFSDSEVDAKKIATYINEHYLIDNIQIEEITNFDSKIYIYKFTK